MYRKEDLKEQYRQEDLQRLRGLRMMDDDFTCKAMEDMRNETDLAARKKMAFKLLQKGKMTIEEIAEVTELSEKEVQEVRILSCNDYMLQSEVLLVKVICGGL